MILKINDFFQHSHCVELRTLMAVMVVSVVLVVETVVPMGLKVVLEAAAEGKFLQSDRPHQQTSLQFVNLA